MTPRARRQRRESNTRGIQDNARMNRKALRGKAEVIMVTNSCGCIYCDLNVQRRKFRGEWTHELSSARVACARAGTQ